MRAGDPTDIPNPFATPQRQRRRGVGKRIARAGKLLALVAIGFGVTLFFGDWSQRWLVQRLTADFETLSATEKKQRLVQVFELGAIGIEPLVTVLADQDDDVARTAYDLLREGQNEWTVLRHDAAHERHCTMVASLKDWAIQIPDDRTGWASGLLQQTILETVNRPDPDSRKLYDDANEALGLFVLSNRAGPSVLTDEPFESSIPQRLDVPVEPLPVNGSDETWTDWPPERGTVEIGSGGELGGVSIGMSEIGGAEISGGVDIGPARPTVEAINPDVETQPVPAPTVYRSASARLQPVAPNQVVLGDVSQPDGGATVGRPANLTTEVFVDSSLSSQDDIRPVNSLIDTPMETFDDVSVIGWLASPHEELRGQAESELVRRGFKEQHLSLARQIVSSDVKTRMDLVAVIARNSSIDPRPWLLMMLDDPNRDVQLRAISALATMNDPDVNSELRVRLVDQTDPIVAARLRRVLDLR